MEQARGRITAIHGDYVTVEVDTASFCSRCSTGKGCGAGLLGADRGPRQVDVPLPRDAHFNPGDEVTLELAPHSLLQAARIVYGMPLAAVAAVGGLAMFLGWSDGTTLIMMLSAVVVAIGIGRKRLQRTNCLQQFTPMIFDRTGTAQ